MGGLVQAQSLCGGIQLSLCNFKGIQIWHVWFSFSRMNNKKGAGSL
jgi:hypothetical protein